MATKRFVYSFIILLVACTCLMGIVTPASAETLNYKIYTYVTKAESAPVGDVGEHYLAFTTRRAFLVFENGEIATQRSVITSEEIKGNRTSLQYTTITFSDGSTIILRFQNTVTATPSGAPASAIMIPQIIKGTGRFEGIKGTGSTKVKYFPVEEGEGGPKGYGEGTLTFTLPSK